MNEQEKTGGPDWTKPVNQWHRRYVFLPPKTVELWRDACNVPNGSYAGLLTHFQESELIPDKQRVQRLRRCRPRHVLDDVEYYYNGEQGIMFVVRRRENPEKIPERINDSGNKCGRHRAMIIGVVRAEKISEKIA